MPHQRNSVELSDQALAELLAEVARIVYTDPLARDAFADLGQLLNTEQPSYNGGPDIPDTSHHDNEVADRQHVLVDRIGPITVNVTPRTVTPLRRIA